MSDESELPDSVRDSSGRGARKVASDLADHHRRDALAVRSHWSKGSRTAAWDELWFRILSSVRPGEESDVFEDEAA